MSCWRVGPKRPAPPAEKAQKRLEDLNAQQRLSQGLSCCVEQAGREVGLSKPAARSGSEPFRLPEAAVGSADPAAILLLFCLRFIRCSTASGSASSTSTRSSAADFHWPRQLRFSSARSGNFWASVWRGTVLPFRPSCCRSSSALPGFAAQRGLFGPQHPAPIVIFPYVVPTVVAVIVWKWLLNSQFGLINYLIEKAGLVEQPISSWARTGSWSRDHRQRVGNSFRLSVIGRVGALRPFRRVYDQPRSTRQCLAALRYVTLPAQERAVRPSVLLRRLMSRIRTRLAG